jgi:hypothetical protein
MTSFEGFSELPGEFGLTVAEIPVPEDADEAWCSMVASAYGGGKYRTIIESYYVLRSRMVPHNRIKRYLSVGCPASDGDAGRINGLIVGAEMVPELNEEGQYIPHLIMVDVEQEDTPYWIAQSPEQEFLVPLSHTDELVLFPDQY